MTAEEFYNDYVGSLKLYDSPKTVIKIMEQYAKQEKIKGQLEILAEVMITADSDRNRVTKLYNKLEKELKNLKK